MPVYSSMKIPVIVVNWNGMEDTIECMESLLATTGPEIMIHLVDNGSDNNEGRLLAQKFHNNEMVRVYQLKDNIGFAKANNQILTKILQEDFKYVALINNDTIVDKNWMHSFLETAVQKEAQMVSAKLLRYDRPDIIDNLGHQMLNTGEIIPVAHDQPAEKYPESFENMGSCAGAALYATDMLRKIGIFDPFFSTGYEDAELGLRAFMAGYRSVYAPDVIILHKGGQSIKKVFNYRYALMIQSSIWYTYFKLVPLTAILVSLPFILIKIILLSVINILFGRWKYLKIQWQALF
ncbi:MAG: glycosyltransferase family 2 protein, partial [Saprospiraceae bacterium]|nr:glycosyltransferase family 2 protein [Saprospiraceae bacterium]